MSSVFAPRFHLRPPKEKYTVAGRWQVREMQKLCDRYIYIYRVFHDLWTLLQEVIS